MAGRSGRYHAPTREAQARRTRSRVLLAAHDLFARQGWATTMTEVAHAAGTSRATVELLFGTKARLLDAVVDVALAGDDEPVAILQRRWVDELAALPAPTFLARVAEAFAAGAQRAAPVLYALDQGSRSSPALTALSDRLRRQRSVMAKWVVDGVSARGALAADLNAEDAVEVVLVLIDPLLLRRLLLERGWSTSRLTRWLTRSLQRLLLAAPP